MFANLPKLAQMIFRPSFTEVIRWISDFGVFARHSPSAWPPHCCLQRYFPFFLFVKTTQSQLRFHISDVTYLLREPQSQSCKDTQICPCASLYQSYSALENLKSSETHKEHKKGLHFVPGGF